MIANVLVVLLGLIVSLFIYWRRLREDYASEIIFSSAFTTYLLIFIAWAVSLRFAPGWFFWLEFLGLLLGVILSVFRFRIRFYESLESFVFSVLPMYSFMFLSDSVARSSLISFMGFVVILAFIFLFYYFESHYKSFSWYKSGKIGFAGLATLGVFFLTRAGIAIFFTSVLSFTGKFEVYISGVFAFLSFLMIFNLGRKEI